MFLQIPKEKTPNPIKNGKYISVTHWRMRGSVLFLMNLCSAG